MVQFKPRRNGSSHHGQGKEEEEEQQKEQRDTDSSPETLASSKSNTTEPIPTTTTRRRVKVVRKKKPPELSEEEKMQGPWFTYLMIQLGGACKNEAKVNVTHEIFEDAYRHNSGEINDKGTKAAKGKWSPEVAVGPFPNWYAADDFKKLCMEDSRGIMPRRDRFIELVSRANLGPQIRCFDKRIVPCNLNGWLAVNDMECLQLPESRLAALYIECTHDAKLNEDTGRAVY